MSYIQAENLKKQYGTADAAVMAVAGMSFTIQMGEFVAVMGESVGKINPVNHDGSPEHPHSWELLGGRT